MKNCRNCKEIKCFEEFHKNNKSKDGLGSSCKKCQIEYAIRWGKENSKKRKVYNEKYKLKNPTKHRELHAKANSKWKKENPGKWNSIAAKYRASKMNATPGWLTKEHLLEIQNIYVNTQEISYLLKIPMAVDHIVPLQGENVSGLHVPWNLQILPKSVNASKKNRLLNE